MEKFYHKLNYSFDISEKVRDDVNNPEGWFETFGFQLKHLNHEVFEDTPLLDLIVRFSGKPLLLKLEPMSWYVWHRDHTRMCGINQLLFNSTSKTFFGNPLPDEKVNKLTKVNYTPGSFFLLNTHTKHTVLNDTDTDRYALSIGFNDFSYDTVLKHCKENSI
jgi:hypothetical protein